MEVTNLVIQKTKHEAFKENRDAYKNRGYNDDRSFSYDVMRLDVAALKDLINAAKEAGDDRLEMTLEVLQKTRNGKFDISVPNFQAFAPMLTDFLRHEMIDGWIYVRGDDGELYPELVQEIEYHAPYRGEEKPYITVKTTFYGQAGDTSIGVTTTTHTFYPKNVSRRKIAESLADKGIFHETKELKAAHLSQLKIFAEEVEPHFGKQFHLTGDVLANTDGWDDSDCWSRVKEGERTFFKRKVIHNVMPSEWGTISEWDESCLFVEKGGGHGRIPRHPVLAVYDLSSHKDLMVNAEFLTLYKYDKTLREKFILPKTHRDLLDVLTTDFKVLTSDIVEGKAAGNIILAKGVPGVGKTLTAEVYSELIERPLLAVHSGLLGTEAEEIHETLEKVFRIAKRWDCALLLDEADVFVQKRDKDVQHNAIVAEFLRTLEYFDGLLFMTTNRPDDIDDAIISRCAAIIEYRAPEADDAKAVWKVMAKQFECELKDQLIKELIYLFPEIVPRDIKMILRLALRMSKAQNKPLSVDVFRQCGMFRAVKMSSIS